MNQNGKICLSLAIIIIVAGVFRVTSLGTNPPAIFRDEAEKGYTAYSIARSGGYFYFTNFPENPEVKFQHLPIFIKVFGVHTSAIYQYFAIPFIALGGLNEWTVRLPSAVVGILTVLFTYLLVSLVAEKFTALISAFFLALSPWHVLFSRWALQGIFVPLLTLFALYFFLKGVQRPPLSFLHKVFYFILSAVFFIVALYAYDVSRVFIPLLLLILLIAYRREIKTNLLTLLPALILFLIFAMLIANYYSQPEAQERFRRISIFTPGALPSQVVWEFLKNYLHHYSPAFLFLRGDSELRHSLLGMGQMYLFNAPLLVYGLWLIVRSRNSFYHLLLAWLLIFPFAASLTREGIPHALRAIVALPMPEIICAIALSQLIRALRQIYFSLNTSSLKRMLIRLFFYLGGVIVSVSVLMFGINLFAFYPYYSALNWQYGVKEALAFIHQEGIQPERVYFSGYITYAPYLIMFYQKISPQSLKDEGIKGIKYKFLSPGVPLSRIWQRLPQDSYLILYPGELFDIKPRHIIPLPTRDKSKFSAPALLIYHKE